MFACECGLDVLLGIGIGKDLGVCEDYDDETKAITTQGVTDETMYSKRSPWERRMQAELCTAMMSDLEECLSRIRDIHNPRRCRQHPLPGQADKPVTSEWTTRRTTHPGADVSSLEIKETLLTRPLSLPHFPFQQILPLLGFLISWTQLHPASQHQHEINNPFNETASTHLRAHSPLFSHK